MSTKNTLFYGDNYHVYQELFDDQKVYLTIDKHEGLISLEGQKLTISLSPEFLTKIAEMWLKNSNRFQAYSEEELELDMDWLQEITKRGKNNDTDN
tara:strand:- start:3718 stop:4005 length:288 start_codon:yes stop_codon:yes gene_type:complete